MPDRDEMPDAVTELAVLARASAVPATAILATEHSPAALGALPSGVTTYMLMTPTSGGGDIGDGWRAQQDIQLDVWAPDAATARAAWSAVRRFLCRRGGHAFSVGSASSVSCSLYPISAPSELPSLARITSVFTAVVSARGGI